MVLSNESTRVDNFWPWWRWVLTGLSVLALALSVFLSWHYLMGGAVIGCGGGSPCDQVLSSRWSSVGGVLPVSGLAAGAYLALLVASFFIGPATAAPDRRLAWGAMLVLVGAAAGSAVWFTIVQKWIVGAFCPYCMATHIVGLLVAALVIWRALVQVENATVEPANPASNPAKRPASAASVQDASTPAQGVSAKAAHRILGRWPAIGLTLGGLALAGTLAGLQLGMTSPVIYRSGQSQANNLPVIVPRAVPLVGSAEATYIVTLLFDYKCPHCQQIHSMLDEAIRRYDGKLAFVLCPSPLSTRCNFYIAREVEAYKDSCELAKLSLTVWVAKREAFSVFDQWMFSAEPGDAWHPRTLEAARAKAIELVGQAPFDAAAADPWIDRYVQTCVRIYGNTINADQSGSAVPKLVFGSQWVTPKPESVDDLMTVLQAGLAVPKP